MHSTYLVPCLLAARALAGPINGESVKHGHSHMAFHKHEARDDTPAENLMNELLSLGVNNPVPQGGNAPPPVVDTVVVTTYVNENPPAPTTSPVAPSSSPPAGGHIKNKIELPAVQASGSAAPAPVQSPASSPAADAANGMPSAPTSFDSSLTGDDETYKNLAILHHNIHRTNHSLPALAWNESLFEIAKQEAQSCVYAHTSPTPPYGQNIAAGNAPGNVSADITNGFYNGEIDLFKQALGGAFGGNSPDMSDFEHWGHATQILWKDTTSFACYTASCAPSGVDPQACNPATGQSYLKNVACGNGGTRAFNLVCNYYPPGNYPNSYSAVPGPDNSMGFVEMTGNGVTGLPGNL